MIDAVMGTEYGERKADKERCRSGIQNAYFYQNISCCSSSLLSVSALRGPYLGAPPLEAAMPLRDTSFLISRVLFQPYRRGVWPE
jgi:hypothetical protein